MTRSQLCFLLSICLLPFLFSCVSTRSAIYFNNIQDSTIIVEVENLEPVIQKNDLLSITVSSSNPELTQMFNLPNASAVQAPGYLVNQDGAIQFPLLGTIKAAGITKKELQQTISRGLNEKKLLLNPTVDVRYINYKIYILGEVARPTVITVPNEKINVLEAISLAGDLTITAKRDNIMVIREEEGRKIIKRLNLSSPDLFKSPYYNLRTNDILYVEPNKSRVAGSSRFNQTYPIVLSSLTFALFLIDRIFR